MNKPFSEIIRGFRIDDQASKKEKDRAEKRKIALNLMLPFLKNNKYRLVRPMAKLLIKDFVGPKKGIENHLLAKHLGIKFDDKNPALTKKKYSQDIPRYNELIENKLRTIKRHLPSGYYIKFNKDFTQII